MSIKDDLWLVFQWKTKTETIKNKTGKTNSSTFILWDIKDDILFQQLIRAQFDVSREYAMNWLVNAVKYKIMLDVI